PSTPGRIFSDHPRTRTVTCYNGRPGLEIPLAGQCEFTVALGCSLVRDACNNAPAEPQTDRLDYAAAIARHSAEWEEFDSRSAICLPQTGIDAVYRTSLYVIRCHQHPILGGITVGSYPDMWNNCVCPSDMS